MQGDKTVYSLFENYCRNLAITILNLQTIFDMETFVIGGGISAQPILIEEVNRQFDKVHHEIDFIGKIIKRPEIVACHHHSGANLIGQPIFLSKNKRILKSITDKNIHKIPNFLRRAVNPVRFYC